MTTMSIENTDIIHQMTLNSIATIYADITSDQIIMLGRMFDEHFFLKDSNNLSFTQSAKRCLKREKNNYDALYSFIYRFASVEILYMPLIMMPLFINVDSMTTITLEGLDYVVHIKHQIIARWRLKIGL